MISTIRSQSMWGFLRPTSHHHDCGTPEDRHNHLRKNDKLNFSRIVSYTSSLADLKWPAHRTKENKMSTFLEL